VVLPAPSRPSREINGPRAMIVLVYPSPSTVPSTCPGVRGSSGSARFSANRPAAGAGTSNVAPPPRTPTSRPPSDTASPPSANHTLSTTGAAPSSGRRMSARMAGHHLIGVITGTDEGAAGDAFEPQRPGQQRQGIELGGRQAASDPNALERRRQALAQRHRA